MITTPAGAAVPPDTAAVAVQPPRRPRVPFGRRGRPRRLSRYATQLHEKQTLKTLYGIRDEQLRVYFRRARRATGETGPNLISLLERRLDNAVYRAGLALTRGQARQLATHGMFYVNGRRVDIPSYQLKEGDFVSVKEGKRGKAVFANFEKRMQNVKPPSWLTLDVPRYAFKVITIPEGEHATAGVDTQAVVEFLAR